MTVKERQRQIVACRTKDEGYLVKVTVSRKR